MDNNKYDMNAKYLYFSGNSVKIGRIERVNEKSIRMSGYDRFTKEEFENVHKLTDAELAAYNGEAVKVLSDCNHKINGMLRSMIGLKNVLKLNEFATVDTEKLQEHLDEMREFLKAHLSKPITIGGVKYTLHEYSPVYLKKVED